MIYKSIPEAVQATIAEIEAAAEQTLQDAGKFAREEALSTTKFKVSDTFSNATQFHTVDKTHGFVLADKFYAQYLEFGNNEKGPKIYPTTAKALHFVAGGKDVFVKWVSSHGPYKFMEEAGDKLDGEIENLFLKNLNSKLT
jgi:hypothetical protein